MGVMQSRRETVDASGQKERTVTTDLLQQKESSTPGRSDWLAALRLYITASAVLHLVWEIAQLPLYTIWKTGTAGAITFVVLHCTAGDVLIATFVMVTALTIFGDRTWPTRRRWPVVIAAVGLGIGYTIYSEWINTVVRKNWTYTDAMPIVPWIGTGLTPLLQWVIVPSLVLAIVARRMARRSTRESHPCMGA